VPILVRIGAQLFDSQRRYISIRQIGQGELAMRKTFKSRTVAKALRRCYYLTVVASLLGCAGATVSQQVENPPAVGQAARPTSVNIYKFAASGSEVSLNSSVVQRVYRSVEDSPTAQEQADIAHQVAEATAYRIRDDIQKMGFATVVLPRDSQTSGNVFVIEGQFVDINEGNRLRRLVIGLGAGQSTVSAQVQMYQLAASSSEPVVQFTANANSGEMPGALILGAPGAAVGGAAAAASVGANVAAGGVKNYRSQVQQLGVMLGDQVAAQFSQYALSQSWITPDLAVKVRQQVSGL
jgi:hypothetical protein